MNTHASSTSTSANATPRDAAGASNAQTPLINELAERLERGGRAAAVFGQPVERERVTVVPVARARWMVGGGTGQDRSEQESGAGGGGAVDVKPVGYIEIKDDQTRFRWICTPTGVMKAVLGGLVAVLLIRRILR